MYGSKNNGGSSFKSAEDAKLILMFGTSPTETRQGGADHSLRLGPAARRSTGAGKSYVIDFRA